MSKDLILLRGVQGSGKTSLAKLIEGLALGASPTAEALAFAADDYFYQEDGSYKFDPDQLHRAHKLCLNKTIAAMAAGESVVIVHNTFSRASELTPYMKAAEEHGYRTFSIIVENRHGGVDVHSVPQEVREDFAKRIKASTKLI